VGREYLFLVGWVVSCNGSEMADLRKKPDVVYITRPTCNFALESNNFMLCANLQFGASLHLRYMRVELGVGWVGSGSMKWTHGQL